MNVNWWTDPLDQDSIYRIHHYINQYHDLNYHHAMTGTSTFFVLISWLWLSIRIILWPPTDRHVVEIENFMIYNLHDNISLYRVLMVQLIWDLKTVFRNLNSLSQCFNQSVQATLQFPAWSCAAIQHTTQPGSQLFVKPSSATWLSTESSSTPPVKHNIQHMRLMIGWWRGGLVSRRWLIVEHLSHVEQHRVLTQNILIVLDSTAQTGVFYLQQKIFIQIISMMTTYVNKTFNYVNLDRKSCIEMINSLCSS